MGTSQSAMGEEIVELLPALAVSLRLSDLLEPAGAEMTPSQLLCAVLVEKSEGQRMSAGEIARRMSISPPAATALVDRLVQAGLLSRSQGADRRVVLVSLTLSGHDVVKRLRDGLTGKIACVLESMTHEAQHSLIEALRKVDVFAREITHNPGRIHSGDPARLATS